MALFWAGVIALVLGIAASILYGHQDGERLFFCSSVVLVIAWLVERSSDR